MITCWASTVQRAFEVLKLVVQPALLGLAHHGALRFERLCAADPNATAAGLRRTILPGIEDIEGEEVADRETAIGKDVGPARQKGATHRHVLVPGLKGRGTPQQEQLGPRILLGGVAGPVIVDFVVIEAHDEGCGGVRALQIGIELVDGVTIAIVVKRIGLVGIAWHHP